MSPILTKENASEILATRFIRLKNEIGYTEDFDDLNHDKLAEQMGAVEKVKDFDGKMKFLVDDGGFVQRNIKSGGLDFCWRNKLLQN